MDRDPRSESILEKSKVRDIIFFVTKAEPLITESFVVGGLIFYQCVLKRDLRGGSGEHKM